MKNVSYRFLVALLSTFIVLQPAMSYAIELSEDAVRDKKKFMQQAREMRAQHAVKQSDVQKQRLKQAVSFQESSNDGCCGCFVITSDNFGEDRNTPVVITEPGKYTLQQDVDFFPADEFTPAIVILANNVTLDLCQHTLSQATDTPNCYGVQIGQGYFYEDPDFVLKNIEVANGNIVDFTAIGVFCYNPSFDGPTAQVAFEDIRLLELNILECGSSPSFDFGSGIALDSFADFTLFDLDLPVSYRNVLIENCNVNRCLGNAAILTYTVDGLVIRNTQANDLSTDVNVFDTVAYVIYGRNVELLNCQGNGTTDLDTVNIGSVTGIFLFGTINAHLDGCQFNNTYGDSSVQTYGGNFPNLQNAILENCQFNNSRGGEHAKIMSGVRIGAAFGGQETEANGIKFINCQFNGTTIDAAAPVATPAYFSINCGVLLQTTRNVTFENCQASNIHTENPNYHSFGYFVVADLQGVTPFFGNAQNITFKNCLASDIRTAGKDAVGFFTGSLDLNLTAEQGQLNNVVVENCIAERISSDSATHIVAGIAEGLYPAEGLFRTEFAKNKNFYVKNCRVSDVRAATGNPLSGGIVVQSVANPILENNSVTDCDVGILFTGTDKIIPNAFQLAVSFENATATPAVPIDIDVPGGPSELQSLENLDRNNLVEIVVPDDINAQHDFLFSEVADLTVLDWQSGDEILYTADGGVTIPGLVDGASYYAIVYRPGYTERGLVQNNSVTNCSVAGFKDDRCPTNSGWINNMALFNGTKPSHKANFAIKWPHKPQVDKGTLGEYPKCPNKLFNTSLIYDKK